MTTKSAAIAGIAMLIAMPAFAQEVPANAGLPETTALGTVAPGQPSYRFGPNGLVDQQTLIDQQLATSGTDPRTGPYDDRAYGGAAHPEANGLNASPILSDMGNGNGG